MAISSRRFPVIELLNRFFGIDLRALALFRILLGVVLLLDYFGRLPDLDAHYTEAGVMPLRAAQAYHATELWLLLSPYTWNGSHDWSLFLMVLGILLSLILIVGWQTRAVTFLSWFLLIGLHTRYPLVQEGGDVYVRMMLFWSLFLPLGARFSVDGLGARLVAHKQPLPKTALSIGTVAMILQVCVVYWFNAIAKSGAPWRTDFTALYMALSLESFTTPAGIWFRDHLPFLLKPLTFIAFSLEAWGTFFAFSPIATGKFRTATAAAFIFFHFVSIGILMDVGPFYYIASLPWILFLPTGFWDKLTAYWQNLPIPRVHGLCGSWRDKLISWRSMQIARALQRGATAPRLQPTLVGNLLGLFFLGYILCWLGRDNGPPFIVKLLPVPAEPVKWITRIDQSWAMFSPYPLSLDEWVVIPAKTADRTVFDLYRYQAPVNFDKPKNVHDFYRNTRWRKYLTNIFEARWAPQRMYYVNYLIKNWDETHKGPQSLAQVWYCVVDEPTQMGKEQPKLNLSVLYTYCKYRIDGKMEPLPPGVPEYLLPSKPHTQGVARNGVNRSR